MVWAVFIFAVLSLTRFPWHIILFLNSVTENVHFHPSESDGPFDEMAGSREITAEGRGTGRGEVTDWSAFL